MIEQKLEAKADTGYSYSKVEANTKFDDLTQGINTAISAAAVAKSSADGKLGKNDQAADSAKLGGAAADKYMNTDKYNPTAANLPNTLALRDENGDFKGRKITAGNFLTTEKAQDDAIDEHSEICYRAAQSSEADPKQMRFATLGKMKSMLKAQAATETKAGIVKLKNSITGNLADTAVSEKAVKEYIDTTKAEISSKLSKTEQAADSAKLGGSPASDYARKSEIDILKTSISDKLGKNETAADSAKLGGISAGDYALKSQIPSPSSRLGFTNASGTISYSGTDNYIISAGSTLDIDASSFPLGQSGLIIINNANNITNYGRSCFWAANTPTKLKSTEFFTYIIVPGVAAKGISGSYALLGRVQ